MNILVTGANGQLGNEMRLISRQTDHYYIFTDVVAPEGVETTILDITDAEAVNRMVTEQHIQCIVNCAAYTNVDKAESDVALCRKLNADAPKILAEAMKAVNGLLIQISTDYVFGGDPYIRKAHRRAFMARPSSKASAIFSRRAANMSLSVPPGFIPSMAGTLSRPCST